MPRSPPPAPRTRNTARACIFINMNGGPSHVDTFDPKDGPWNPSDADIRQYPGGIVLSRKYFPKLSTMTGDLLAVARLRQLGSGARARASSTSRPRIRSIRRWRRRSRTSARWSPMRKGAKGLLPPFMAFNQSGMQGATFLGGPYAPMMPPATRTGVATLSHQVLRDRRASSASRIASACSRTSTAPAR